MKLKIHHIELCVSDPVKTLKILKDQFGFEIVGTRNTQICEQIVVQSKKKIFVITHRKNNKNQEKKPMDLSYSYNNNTLHSNNNNFQHIEPWTIFCCDGYTTTKSSERVHVDSVFNIAIQVENLIKIIEHLKKIKCIFIQDLTTVISSEGPVKYAILKSCCGNIVHTLIEKTEYYGKFLPEFVSNNNDGEILMDNNNLNSYMCLTSHFDHVAVVCRPGETYQLIEWYSQAFEMKRFFTNREDSEENGIVIGGEVGMRLKVLEFWKCSEIGLVSSDWCSNADKWEPLKLVIAESLPNTSNSSIDTFIRDHGGPGLQHIGLYTSNIFETVEKMTSNGVQFRRPPPAYYTQIGQLNVILAVGENLESLEKCGILLDSEADADVTSDNSAEEKYLMQVFTHPIFDRATFFLEVIQRKGAQGFGVGNVTALARSINAYMIGKT